MFRVSIKGKNRMMNQNVTMPCFKVRESQASIKWEGILNIRHLSKLLIYDLSVPIVLPPLVRSMFRPSSLTIPPFPHGKNGIPTVVVGGRRLPRKRAPSSIPFPLHHSSSPPLFLLLVRFCDVILFPLILFLPFSSFLNPFPLSAVAKRPQTSTTILYRSC